MKRLHLLAICLIAMVFAGPGIAESTAASISGTVTDGDTHAALDQVNVVIYDANGSYYDDTSTNSSGQYAVAGLPAGSYKVSFQAGQSRNYARQYYNGKGGYGSADAVVLGASTAAQRIDAELQAGGQVAGTVTDAVTNAPLEEVEIDVFDAEGNYESFGVTDEDGHYVVSGLSAGDHLVGFISGGNYVVEYYDEHRSLEDADPVAVTAGAITGNIDASLARGGQIKGTVTDPNSHEGVPDIAVSAYDAAGNYASSGFTDEDGHYVIRGLGSGTYTVEFASHSGGHSQTVYYDDKQAFEDANPVSVTEGSDVAGIDAEMDAGGQIRGRITDATTGDPIEQAQVTVFSTDGYYVASAWSDADGDYRIHGLDTDQYKLQFSAGSGTYRAEFYNDKASLAAADPVSVQTDQTTAGIDAGLSPGARITGTVRSGTTHAPATGVLVVAYPTSGSPAPAGPPGSGGSPVGFAQTGPDGTYALSGLNAGSYRLYFQALSGSLRSEFYNDKQTLDEADLIPVSSGQTISSIDADLGQGGQIDGDIVDAGTQLPVASANVAVYDSDGDIVTSTFTDNAGHFITAGLEPGHYRVGYLPANSGLDYLDQFYNGKASLTTADTVSVSVDQVTHLARAELAASGTISGRVTDEETGAPLGNASVTVYNAATWSYVRSAFTGSDGTYTAHGLATGSYFVRFTPSGLNASEFYDGKDQAHADQIAVTAGQATNGIDATLSRGGGISGTVTDSQTHAPAGGMLVSAYSTASGAYVSGTLTSADGTYRIPGLANGEYLVRFSSSPTANYVPVYYHGKTYDNADHVTVSDAHPTLGIDQEVDPGGSIAGNVVDSETHQPVSGVSVSAFASSGSGHGSTTTDASGHFVVNGLETSSYTLSFYDNSGFHLQTTRNEPASVTVATNTTIADFELEPAGNLTGTVRDADDDSPIRNSVVTLHSWTISAPRTTNTDSSGHYAFRALPPGSYSATFSGGDGGDYGESSYGSGSAGTGTTGSSGAVTVEKRATTSGIDGQLKSKPQNSAQPSVSGIARQGETLTASAGQWTRNPTSTAHQWLRCDTDGNSCSPITGATNGSFTAGSSDVGHRLAVRVTASNSAGDGMPADSTPTAVVLPQPPVNVLVPKVSGVTRQGEQIGLTHGSWTNNPTSYSYQWSLCDSLGSGCFPIAGATSATYTPTESDVGHRLKITETAINAGGSSDPASSSASAVIVPVPPVNQTRPTIAGQAKQGETLVESHGQWSGQPTSLTYRWLRCDADGANCQAISEALSQQYTLRGADVGRTIVAEETASNDGGAGSPSVSLRTAVVVATRPANTSAPSISGQAKQGVTLGGSNGSWTNEPASYDYTWLACAGDVSPCEAITGATSSTFTPTESEVGKQIVLRVVATNAGGASLPATSTPTAAVIPPVPGNTSAPTISGMAIEGQTLTAAHGEWTNNPTSYSLQWKRCDSAGLNCVAIIDETGGTYTLVTADVGKRIVVSEQTTNAAGTSAEVTSDPTGAVIAGSPVNTAQPTISGVAREARTLTADTGIWTNSPDSFGYQWLACAADGSGCAPIQGETDSTHRVRNDEVGKRLAVNVTATNPGGTGLAARSQLTGLITAADPPDTTIGQKPPALTSSETQTISFSSDVDGSTFECRLGDDDFAACSSPKTYTGLADGQYAFDIRAKDAVGRIDATPARATWTIDRTPPQTTITRSPSDQVHASAVFEFASSEPGTFECAIDNGAYEECESGHALSLSGIGPGSHSFHVRARDQAGNIDPSAASEAFDLVNTAPQATLDVTPDAGTVDLHVQAVVSGTDADDDDLEYKIDFGDGTLAQGSLPDETLTHTYRHAGVYAVRLEIDDGHAVDVVTTQVTVVLAEPLHADAGDDLVAVAGESVTLDGQGSRPSVGIEDHEWDFGDGHTGTGAVADHVYADPGTYTATLHTQTGDDEDDDTALIRVVPASSAEGIGVSVHSGGGPVAGADVMIVAPDGRRISVVSDSSGRARLRGLADGEYTVLTYAPGYLPKSTHATVSGLSGTANVELTPGEVAKAKITTRPLSLQEILDRGIDPNDPANQHIYDFKVGVGVDSFGGSMNANGEFIPGPKCTRFKCRADIDGSRVVLFPFRDGITALTLPASAHWLKEFFDVSMTVHNLSDSAFDLRNGKAWLDLPAGLSLAPTAHHQSASVSMPNIAGGRDATASWTIRGDAEGDYDIAASYAATLEPFGRSVSVRAQTDEPLKVWGGSALKLTVEVDDTIGRGHPLHARIGLKNVSDKPVYNPGIDIPSGESFGYIVQPRQKHSFSTSEISPGQTFWAGPVIFVPNADGTVDLSESFVKKVGGDADVDATIVTSPRDPSLEDNPKARAHARDNAVVIDVDAIDGATDYEVYATPDPLTEFSDTPLPVTKPKPGRPTKLMVPATPGERMHYAVVTRSGSDREMIHPLVTEDADSNEKWPKVDIRDSSDCDAVRHNVVIDIDDEDFGLTKWQYREGEDDQWHDGGALSGDAASTSRAVIIDAARGPIELSVRAQNEQQAAISPSTYGPGETKEIGSCRYVALGDSFSSGEGVPGDDGTFISDGRQPYNCHRSPKAYPQLVAGRGVNTGPTSFDACSSAVITGLENNQLGSLGTNTKLVTLTIGGNDAYFADVLSTCVATGGSTVGFGPSCASIWGGETTKAMDRLKSSLPKLYSKIRQRAGYGARILVLEYPQIFPAISKPRCAEMNPTDVYWLHQSIKRVNEIVEDSTISAQVEFVSLGTRFRDHDVCGLTGSLFNNIDLGNLKYSFHPNEHGQAAMADAVAEYLNSHQNLPGLTNPIRQGQTQSHSYAIASGQSSFTASSSWPGSDVVMTLVSPSGRTITRSTSASDIEHDVGPTQETFKVTNPEPGSWTIRLFGADIDPQGEPVTLRTTQVPIRNLAPFALFDVSRSSALTGERVSFDSEGSIDADGTIASYKWDFGDGDSGTGATATHAFSTAGTYSPSLTVTDNRGETDTYYGTPITIAGGPTSPGTTAGTGGGSTQTGAGSTQTGGGSTQTGAGAGASAACAQARTRRTKADAKVKSINKKIKKTKGAKKKLKKQLKAAKKSVTKANVLVKKTC